jgi:hypothetical protein
VNLFRDCPFWVNDAVCTQHGCSICECDEDEVKKQTNQHKEKKKIKKPKERKIIRKQSKKKD